MGRLSSDSFDAAAPTGESMRVSQSSVNSLVGRLGVVAGVESNKGNFYAKANLFHEFDGDGHILFTEPGKTGKRSSFSLKDTWVEIALGGNYYLSPKHDLCRFHQELWRRLQGRLENQCRNSLQLLSMMSTSKGE
ncbi:MAG: autotransporter domain-containing protein [Dialister invisus]